MRMSFEKKTMGWLVFSLSFSYLFILQIQAAWPFTIDDMYIPLRYARQWSEGSGLVWNRGEAPVEGYSNFLFLLVGYFSMLLHINPVIVLKSMGVLGLLLAFITAYTLSRFWFRPELAIIPSLWLITYQGEIIWAVSGLETSVYQALLGMVVCLSFYALGYSWVELKEKNEHSSWYMALYFMLAAIMLVIMGLTRPEAPALMLLFTFLMVLDKGFFNRRVSIIYPSHLKILALYSRFLRLQNFKNLAIGLATPRFLKFCGRKNQVVKNPVSSGVMGVGRGFIAYCLVLMFGFAPYLLWKWFYYGNLFPNPVYCKGFLSWKNINLDLNYLRLIWPFALLSVFGIMNSNDRRHYWLWLPTLLYLILLIGSDPIVAFNNRLFLPAFMLLLPLAWRGTDAIIQRFVGQDNGVYYFFMYFSAFLIAFFFIPSFTLADYQHFTQNPIAGERLREQVAIWLNEHIPANSRVVLGDSGLIPYRSHLNFIDSYCLNNREMTHYGTPPSRMFSCFCRTIWDKNPEVIILTSLIEKGKVIYAPADACLVKKLRGNKQYHLQSTLNTTTVSSIYQYEIYRRV